MAKLQHPGELRYSKSDEWVKVAGNEATIGISDYAQDQLGDIVSIELPWDEAGSGEVRAERPFGNVDSVKASAELVSPVSGTILKINDTLRDAPELINSDPYEAGWMLVVQLSNPAELDALMSGEAYIVHIGKLGS